MIDLNWTCQLLLDIRVKPWYMTVSLRERAPQERAAEQGLSLRTPPPWSGWEKEKLTQRLSEGREETHEHGVMESREAKKTSKELRSPVLPGPGRGLTGRGRHCKLCQLMAISGNWPWFHLMVLALAHAFASLQQAVIVRDLISNIKLHMQYFPPLLIRKWD